MGHQQHTKLFICPNLFPNPDAVWKESRKHCQYLAGEFRTFTVRGVQPLLLCKPCGEKGGLTKPGLARGSCQQVKLAWAPVASCLWPSPVDKPSYRGDIVLSTLQGAMEPLYSAKNHNSSLIHTHYTCAGHGWALLATVYRDSNWKPEDQYMKYCHKSDLWEIGHRLLLPSPHNLMRGKLVPSACFIPFCWKSSVFPPNLLSLECRTTTSWVAKHCQQKGSFLTNITPLPVSYVSVMERAKALLPVQVWFAMQLHHCTNSRSFDKLLNLSQS